MTIYMDYFCHDNVDDDVIFSPTQQLEAGIALPPPEKLKFKILIKDKLIRKKGDGALGGTLMRGANLNLDGISEDSLKKKGSLDGTESCLLPIVTGVCRCVLCCVYCVHMSVSLSLCLFSLSVSVSLSLTLSLCPYLCLSLSLSLSLCLSLSLSPSVPISVSVSLYLSLCICLCPS